MVCIQIFINGKRINMATYFGDVDWQEKPDSTRPVDPARANEWYVDYLYNTTDAESVYAAQTASKTAPVDIDVVFPDGETVFSNKGKVVRTTFCAKVDRPIMSRVVFALQGDWTKSVTQTQNP